MSFDDTRNKIKHALELIEAIPEDRLDTLNKSMKLRDVILSCLATFNAISDVKASERFSDHNLNVIRGHFAESARPLVELTEYFMNLAESEKPWTLAV